MKVLLSWVSVVLGSVIAVGVMADEIDWSGHHCKPLALARTTISHPSVPANLKVEDFTYSACDGKTITAYLISPPRPGTAKYPAILYVHWFDPRVKNSNREEFVEEAVAFVQKGGVALLISTFWSVPGGYYDQRRWQDDYKNTLNQVRDLRRALNILRDQPAVDKTHVAYVGHDYGAVFGAIMAPLEPEIKTWALVAGTGEITDWYLYGSASGTPNDTERVEYVESFTSIQPHIQLKKAQAPVLLQFADKDEFIDAKQQQLLRVAAPVGSEFKLYNTNHAMELPQVRADREQWVSEKLLFKK